MMRTSNGPRSRLCGLLVAGTILFVSAGSARAAGIFIMRADGTQVRRVAQVQGCGDHGSPRFSHDDRKLAFDAAQGAPESRRFFVINTDGTGLQESGAHGMPDWSPDDKQLAYHNLGVAAEPYVCVANLDGQGLASLTSGSGPRWSPDGGQLAFTDGRSIKLLDTIAGGTQALTEMPFDECLAGFDFSPDGRRLALVAKRAGVRELWIVSAEPGAKDARVRITGELAGHVSWSPDGKRLAIGLKDKIQLLDVEGTGEPQPIAGQQGKNWHASWSHDGGSIAFASDRPSEGQPQTATRPVWRLQLQDRKLTGVPAYSVALSADGQRAVLGTHTAKAGFQVWDIASGSVTPRNFGAVFLTLSPDGQTMAGSGLNLKVQLVDVEKGELKKEISLLGLVTSLRFSNDGSRLIFGMLNKRAQVHDVATGKAVCNFAKHEGIVMHASFSADGKEGLSVGQDKTLRIWDSGTGTERLSVPHPEPICGLAVSLDGRMALTGTGGAMPNNALDMTMAKGTDNVLRAWDVASGKLVREMKGHTHAVYAIDVTADGRVAASGGWDGTIRIWDLQTGEQIAEAQGEGSVMDLKFSADGKTLLVGGGATRFAGETVRYFGRERARVFQLTRVEDSTQP